MLLVGEDSEDPATKVIVVSFLASHCKPCRKELPVMQQLHQKYRDQGLRIIGVAIDSEPEGQKVMAQLLAEAKITFPVVKDQYNLTARRYLGNKVPLPSVFVLDKGGKIQLVSRGYSEEISKKLFDALARGLGVPVSLETPANPAEKGVTRSTRSKKSSKEPAKRGVETKK
jgi:thiol-disulfide isomerase/thioredoxin